MPEKTINACRNDVHLKHEKIKRTLKIMESKITDDPYSTLLECFALGFLLNKILGPGAPPEWGRVSTESRDEKHVRRKADGPKFA